MRIGKIKLSNERGSEIPKLPKNFSKREKGASGVTLKMGY